jgi:hypothetical protein
MSPKIYFAKTSAIESFDSIFMNKNIRDAIYNQLDTNYARSVFPDIFIDDLIKTLRNGYNTFLIPQSCKSKLVNSQMFKILTRKYKRRFSKYDIPISALSLRAYIVVRMNAILSSDSKALSRLPRN